MLRQIKEKNQWFFSKKADISLQMMNFNGKIRVKFTEKNVHHLTEVRGFVRGVTKSLSNITKKPAKRGGWNYEARKKGFK